MSLRSPYFQERSFFNFVFFLMLISLSAGFGNSIAKADEKKFQRETATEVKLREIAGKLRCPVCQGESIYDSNAEVALQMKTLITEKIQAGESEEAIIGYFVDRYGNFVLMEPPTTGIHWIIWILPMLFAAVGLIALSRTILTSQNESHRASEQRSQDRAHPIEELEL